MYHINPMSCIGTAGHVDHGKSTLVKVLTGIDPDRLTEEKERGMTIDLGFAWLTLPSGREVSIVDVPGHESFIKNMLAGVGGIDAALLVIAADEGVMPQTREHLAILDLLRVQRGIVVLTKVDLVDEEWLALVHEEVVEQLNGTTLVGAPILPVSAYTGQGMPTLLAELDNMLAEEQDHYTSGRPRLSIDRVFTMSGFGTIVTGTLLDGTLKVGQEVELLPQHVKTRIRGLQTHRQQVEMAVPGSRVAINLANIARSGIERGNVVALAGQLRPTLLFDARISLLADARWPLLHNMHTDLYAGAQEIPARIRLLDTDELQPGQSAWAQVRLSRPAVLACRDRFILRIPSPSATIGGGEVIDVHPRYHRRFQLPVLDTLERLAQGSTEELVLAALDRRPTTGATVKSTKMGTKGMHTLQGYELADIAEMCNLAENVTLQVLETLLLERRVRKVGTLWFAQHIWDRFVEEALQLVREQHHHYPLRSGLSKEEWRTRLNLSSKVAAEVFVALQTEGLLEMVTNIRSSSGGLIRLPDFMPTFSAPQQAQVDQLLQVFYLNPYMSPGRAGAEAIVGSEVLAVLIEQGRIVKLTEGILFLRETYEEALAKIVTHLEEYGKITAAEARDLLGATRKYVLPLLEHMDALRITRRLGDERVLATTTFHT